MEREQIIKALECCTSGNNSSACEGCPFGYEEGTCDEDSDYLPKQALSLIRELIEENKRLRAKPFGIMDKVKERMEEQRTTPKCKHYKRTSDDSTCVSCGMAIPEGRQICHSCEVSEND